MSKRLNLKKYINGIFVSAALALLTACTVTPESVERKELTPVVRVIDTPVISQVTVDHSVDSPSITVLWEPVDKATFYVFEYESATDYLSGESKYKSFITNSNTYTLSSEYFTNASDMRYVFKVKAAYQAGTTGSILYSSDSDLTEAAIVNSFSMSPVIQNNTLTIYSAFPKIKSVLGNGNIITPKVEYYFGDELLDSNTRELSSAESATITGVLKIGEDTITTKSVDIKNSVDYYPAALKEAPVVSKNLKGYIDISWKANSINAGIEEYSPKMQFSIERRESSSDSWTTLKDSDGNTLYIPTTGDGNISYQDKTALSGKDYVYRVITQYVLTFNENTLVSFDSSKDKEPVSDVGYVQDTKVKSFIVTLVSGFVGDPAVGDATYTVDLNWTKYHELPENMKYVVTRWDWDETTVVDGNPTDESGTSTTDKYVTVYTGTDTSYSGSFTLSAEDNKKVHNYTYYIQIVETDSSSDNPMTQAKYSDGRDGIVKTNPTTKAISFISSLTATKDSKALADKIKLDWTYNVSEIEEAGLDIDKVSVHILKKASSDSEYTDINQGTSGIFGTSYEDEDVEAGTTYTYILKPYYNDSDSPYNGLQSAVTELQATGSILSPVDSISASINTSNSDINVTWNAVDNAHGYVIYYREKGNADWTESTKVESLVTSADISENLNPGTRYEITVSVVDSANNSKASDAVIAEGEILGNVKDLKATGDTDIKADYITVTWDPVENATSYIVNIYDDKDDDVYSETLRDVSNCSYTLKASSDIITSYAETHEYALSRKYRFTVTPVVKSVKPTSTPAKAEGYWIMPPKNITATKATYRDLITISWDVVDNASGYTIYYRQHDSSDEWKYLNNVSKGATSIDYYNSSEEYDFTVSTVVNNVEGCLQSYFEDESNYGYALIIPQRVICTDVGNNFFKLSFMEVLGATSYQITFEDSSWELKKEDISTIPLTVISANTAEKDGNGLISYYITRPTPKYKVTFNSAVAATNKNASISSKNTTSFVNATVMYATLTENELIKIALYNLNYVFTLVNGSFDEEWWPSSRKQISDSGISASSCWGTSGFFYYNPANNGYINLTNYSLYGNKITGNITCFVEKNQTNGYLEDDPLERVTSSGITIQLPGKFPDIKVSFDDYYVNNTKGTVTINGKDFALSSFSPTLLQEVK